MKSAFFQRFCLTMAIQPLIYSASRLLCLGIAKAFHRLHVEGEEQVPWTGPAILAANHVSFIDPIIVGVSVRRPVHFMAKEELFRFRPFGRFLRALQAFPVNRRRLDLQAMNQAISLLEQGQIVVIFPEGTRGDGMHLGAAKPGIGLIAARSGAPVIPVFHRGTERVLPRGAWFPRPHRITVKFGPPLRFGETLAGEEQEQFVAFSQMIMKRIAALKARSEGGGELLADRAHVTGDTMPTETREING